MEPKNKPASKNVIGLDRAASCRLRIAGQDRDVWMVTDMDRLIDDYVSLRERAREKESKKLPEQKEDLFTPFGATLWPSGRGFSQWIASQVADGHVQLPSKALELGCGVGMVSCVLASLGIPDVVATDHEPALEPFVLKNAQSFDVSGRVRFAALDWFDDVPQALLKRFPLVVACDVLYENEHLAALPQVAQALLTSDGVFYLADPERYRFQEALRILHQAFATVETTSIDLHPMEAESASGVVSQGTQLSRIRILACRGPRGG